MRKRRGKKSKREGGKMGGRREEGGREEGGRERGEKDEGGREGERERRRDEGGREGGKIVTLRRNTYHFTSLQKLVTTSEQCNSAHVAA